MIKISIILPTYNESGNIGKLIKEINQQKSLQIYQKEYIVIDDNSPDNTANIVKGLINQGLPIKLFVRKKIRGLASAVALGIKNSTSKNIILMDTDFNHQSKDIYQLLLPIINNQADLVIGSRYIKGGGMHVTEANFWQFYLSKLGNFFINRILLHLPVQESLSGFVAFKHSLIKAIDQPSIFQGYGDYCIRLLYYTHRLGYKIREIPVIYGKRQYGKSKSCLIKMITNDLRTAISLCLVK